LDFLALSVLLILRLLSHSSCGLDGQSIHRVAAFNMTARPHVSGLDTKTVLLSSSLILHHNDTLLKCIYEYATITQ